ncbi:MAG: hypothetical protein ABW133_19675 [Polyangiaceae bacterium]
MRSSFSARRLVSIALAAVFVASGGAAWANGRFPRAQRLREDPTNPDGLALAATYGILVTSDRGEHWRHVCEASFAGLQTYTGDPLLDFTNDGTMLVGVQSTLNVSRDLCGWTPKLGGGAAIVLDYTIVRSSAPSIVALVATYRNGVADHALWKSVDGAEHWTLLGAVPATTAYTLDVDPRDDAHIYVTVLDGGVGKLLRTRDDGRTWTAIPIPNTDIARAPYIAALDPNDANRIYVRTDGWVPIDGILTADDALLVSNDGGDTWTEAFRQHAKLLGFALSPDGKEVLLGYGDPFAAGTAAVPGRLGVFKSATDAFDFDFIFPAHVSCLAWTARGVYVCASQHFDGFELGFSPLADFRGDAGCLAQLLRLSDVKGPVDCPAGTSGEACNVNWLAACFTFGTCTDGGTTPKRCAGDNGAATADGGTIADASADAGRQSDGDGRASTEGGATGCGCRMHERSKESGASFTAIALACLALRRRRTADCRFR